MTLRSPGPASLTMALLAVASAATAHHSTAFYSEEFVEIEGEIARVDWINPHVRFELRTTGADGGDMLYRMEASAISALERRGVTRELFNVGDRVTIAAHPSTRNPLELQVTNVLLADGREASLWLDSPSRFAHAGDTRGAQVVQPARQFRDALRAGRHAAGDVCAAVVRAHRPWDHHRAPRRGLRHRAHDPHGPLAASA